jgi:hypothetical protein
MLPPTAGSSPENVGSDSHLSAEVEYQQAHEWWRHLSTMRRQDLAMFAAIQGAALSIIGDQLLALNPTGAGLSIIAFLVAVMGLNNERQLHVHLLGFRTVQSLLSKCMALRWCHSGSSRHDEPQAWFPHIPRLELTTQSLRLVG